MPDVKLHRPGWTNSNWNPHGLFKPVRFNEDDTATIDEDSFDEWIGDDMARVQGITVTRPSKPEPKPKSKPKPKPIAAAKKSVAKKKPAAKKPVKE
jgi:hypothetical protein